MNADIAGYFSWIDTRAVMPILLFFGDVEEKAGHFSEAIGRTFPWLLPKTAPHEQAKSIVQNAFFVSSA